MNEKGIDQAEWRPLHAIDTARLSEARLQAHYAAQWLARAARAYVPPRRVHFSKRPLRLAGTPIVGR
jgi:hypothetical protein